MLKPTRYALVSLALFTAILLPTVVQAQSSVFRTTFRGNVADVFCFGTDPVTGVITEVSAFCVIGRTHQPGGPPVAIEEGAVSIFQFDPNTGGIAFGSAALDDCSIARLESATLIAVDVLITFFDFDFNVIGEGEADVDLTLTGFGDVSRERFRSSFMGEDFTFRFSSMARIREAEVSGDISVDGTDVTPFLECFGLLANIKEGVMIIERP